MNVIETYIAIQRVCEAYGAKFSFRRLDLPIVCTLPSQAVVHCFTDELLNLFGIDTEVNGCEVTFNLS